MAFCTLECQAKVAAKLLILIGVPREFELEHPLEPSENAGFAASVLHDDVESGTYGLDFTGSRWFLVYPYCVLNRVVTAGV